MDQIEKIRLTQFAHGAGCGCKISPQVLETILAGNKPDVFGNLLVGNKGNDDAAVLKLNESEALISTTDFFTPIVDDAFVFGQTAAANALSDVYAMGGKPILALAILGWPIDKLPASLANQVLEGARSICEEAGIPLAGGHSIDSPEPIFGLSVNGLVKINHLKKNNTAKAGDLIFITKALGTGILATAAKRDLLPLQALAPLYAQLSKLNSIGTKLGESDFVTALTDVTGFGIMGHLIEMAEGSGLTAEIQYDKLPILEHVKPLLSQNIIPDATYRNWNAYGEKTTIDAAVNPVESFQILPDPQTNGGLLIAVDPAGLELMQEILAQNGYEAFCEPIGKFVAAMGKGLRVES